MTTRTLPPLGKASDLALHLRPGANPGNDADCAAVGHMRIAIAARDRQVAAELATAIEEAENGYGTAGLRRLFVTLGGKDE